MGGQNNCGQLFWIVLRQQMGTKRREWPAKVVERFSCRIIQFLLTGIYSGALFWRFVIRSRALRTAPRRRSRFFSNSSWVVSLDFQSL